MSSFEKVKAGQPVHSFSVDKEGLKAIINAENVSGISLSQCGGQSFTVENFVCVPLVLERDGEALERVRTNIYAEDGTMYSCTNDMVARMLCSVLDSGIEFPIPVRVEIKASQNNAQFKYPVLVLV